MISTITFVCGQGQKFQRSYIRGQFKPIDTMIDLCDQEAEENVNVPIDNFSPKGLSSFFSLLDNNYEHLKNDADLNIGEILKIADFLDCDDVVKPKCNELLRHIPIGQPNTFEIEYMLHALSSPCHLRYRFTNLGLCTIDFEETNYLRSAAQQGHLHCLKFLRQRCVLPNQLAEEAAKHGQLSILQYLIDEDCFISQKAIQNAAGYGHVECLELLYKHVSNPPVYQMEKDAARNGHLACLQTIYKHSASASSDLYLDLIAGEALEYGHLHIFEWFRSIVPTIPCRLSRAARGGHLKILELLWEHGRYDDEILGSAAIGGHLECLQYLLKKIQSPSYCMLSKGCYEAAVYGHLSCLELLHKRGGVLNLDMLNWALINKRVDCAEYLIQNDCPVNERAMIWVAECGRLDLVKKVYNQVVKNTKCAVLAASKADKLERMLNWALVNERFDCAEYLIQNDCPANDRVMIWAAECGRLDLVKKLYNQGVKISELAVLAASQADNLECLRFILEHRESNVDINMDKAIKRRRLENIQVIKDMDPITHSQIQEKLISAASSVDLDQMKRYIAQGLKVDESMVNWAIMEGHLPCVKYLHGFGIKPDNSAILTAIRKNFRDVLQFLVEKGFVFDDKALLAVVDAPLLDQLDMIKWLVERGAPFSSKTVETAAKLGETKLVQYFHSQGCRITRNVIKAGYLSGNIDMIKYLLANEFPLKEDFFY